MHRKAALTVLVAAVLTGSMAAALTSQFSPFGFLRPWRPNASLLVSGNIEAHESVLSFKAVQSRIVELPFDEGQWVKRGTLVARLDDSDYRQNVEVARAVVGERAQQLAVATANLEAARRTLLSDRADLNQKAADFRRFQQLWEGDALSTQNRDLAETAYKQSHAMYLRDQALEAAAEKNIGAAEAALKSAQETLKFNQIILGYTVLRAPFDGVIQTREAELGEVMLPSTPVVTLADLDHVWLRAYINETDIGRVRYGQSAVITTDTYPDKEYRGRISAIASHAEFTPKSVETHAERVTLVYRIKIDLYNPAHELVPGMPADARIQLEAVSNQHG